LNLLVSIDDSSHQQIHFYALAFLFLTKLPEP